MPQALQLVVFDYGSAGVAIFFVLSGFVITHSFVKRPFGVQGLGEFAIRRSIRLDPPYWACIAVSLGVLLILNSASGGDGVLPTAPDVFLHLVYARPASSAL